MGRVGSPSATRTSPKTEVSLRRISRLPSLEELSLTSVTCNVAAVDAASAEVVLNKPGWKEPACAKIPLRHLRAGMQDVTLRVPRLGQVCFSVNYGAPDLGDIDDSPSAMREAELNMRPGMPGSPADAARKAREEAQQREAAEAKRREETAAAAQLEEEQAAAEAGRRREEERAAVAEAEAAARRQAEEKAKKAAEDAKQRAEEKRQAEEEARKAEEEILAEQRRKKEEREAVERKAAEKLQAEEEARQAEEEILAEQKRKKEEREAAERKAAEKLQAEEEARKAEEEILAEQKRKKEEREAREAAAAREEEERERREAAEAAALEARRKAEEEEAPPSPEELELIDGDRPPAVTVAPSPGADDDETYESGEEGTEASEMEATDASEVEGTDASEAEASEVEGEEEDESEGEEEDESEEETLAELSGDLQVGCTLTVELPAEVTDEAEAASQEMNYSWHRVIGEPDDSSEWEAVEGADTERYVLTAEDVGCSIFAEWRVLDSTGEAVREGATEAAESTVRLMPEDREDLKAAVLEGSCEYEVRTHEGPAKLHVSRKGISLKSRFGGTKIIDLAPKALKVDAADPAGLVLTQPAPAKPIACGLTSAQERDLLLLAASAFEALEADASFEGLCKVWEGEGYGDYWGKVYGQVMLLYEGAEAPADETEPTEALMLHGCKAEAVDAEEGSDDGPELSITDSGGEIFSLSFGDEAARDEWKEAVDTRNDPAAIARASHILIKHNESRRVASWRDEEGREIRNRSKADAIRMLKEYKKLIEAGKEDLATIAEQVSDCDTAKHGGDLGWFAANYMQPEFEAAVLKLPVPEEGEDGELILAETASGCHLIQRTG